MTEVHQQTNEHLGFCFHRWVKKKKNNYWTGADIDWVYIHHTMLRRSLKCTGLSIWKWVFSLSMSSLHRQCLAHDLRHVHTWSEYTCGKVNRLGKILKEQSLSSTWQSKSVKNQEMKLQRTVLLSDRQEPVCRWEKVQGHPPPWHCTYLGFKTDWPNGCLASLKRHVRTRFKFVALILCGMAFRGPWALSWTHFNISEERWKRLPAGKNAEYTQNMSYTYCGHTWEENVCHVCTYVVNLYYQCNVLAFLFNTFTKNTWKHSSSTDFIIRLQYEKIKKNCKTLFCTLLQNYMWNMQLLLIASNCTVCSDTRVHCKESTASRFS